ncbi:TetR/AcrR family transcriptional regulator [Nocardioides sp.]|uniref:TetR/AcrR family transcriptional regulator n=1 Tax=Nocardioides sp. TaxID=35761 RepID=UPI0026347868|nr:TetR/AcrR family transcriptional regulator [Nocardioides sp.]MDI6912321.1 TetR/AcrR family transcriptional regulator [Nocardioides sp.]
MEATPSQRDIVRPPAPGSGERIVETALDQFAVHGYAATSMRDLADAVGMRAASLYNHFSSKEMLLWHICQWTIDSLSEIQQDTLGQEGSPSERLSAFTRSFAQFHATHSREALTVEHNWRTLEGAHLDTLRAYRRKFYRALVDIIEEGRAAGEFGVRDSELTALNILDLVIGIANWYRSANIEPEALGEHYARLALLLVEQRPQ